MLTDPDASNSTSVSDPRMTTELAIGLARQGDPVIIATLMNRLLEADGINASAQRRGDCLHITLIGAEVPDQTTMLRFVQRGLLKLQPQAITTVLVAGQKDGTDQPSWQEQFCLEIPSPIVETQSSATDNAKDPEPTQITSEFTPIPDLPPLASPQYASIPQAHLTDLSWIGAILAVLVTIGFTGGIIWYLVAQLSQGHSSPQQASLLKQTPASVAGVSANGDLKVVGVNWEIRYANPNLIGQLTNTSNRQYTYVKIEFNLYDEAGKKVGEAMAIVTQVDPQSQREFEAPIVEQRVKKATVKSITAF